MDILNLSTITALLCAASIPAMGATITESIPSGYTGGAGAFSGGASTTQCDPLVNPNPTPAACDGFIDLSGDYYFSGSGIATFPFGSFSNMGAIGPNVTLDFSITGPGLISQLGGILNAGNTSPILTLVLGETYHITYSATWMLGGQNGGFSYQFSAPQGIMDVTDTPEPSSKWLVLGVIPLLLQRLRRSSVRTARAVKSS